MTLIAMLTMTVSTNAMSFEQARNEALFLTDKMAYELNLTDEQYEAAYEINLDYLMGAISCSTGSGRPIWQPTISIAHSTGRLVTGTLASMPAIRTVTISTSDVRPSMPPIVEDMLGTFTVLTATTTSTGSISVHPETDTLACMTAGIVASSATIVTVPLV